MVAIPLRESGDAWDLLRGGLASFSSAFLVSHNISNSTAANNGGPVLIFTASADPDALASVRTLTALLKADLIRYEVHPVDGYVEMQDKFQILVTGDAAIQPRAILCVNCGAMVDVSTILQLERSDIRDVTDARVLIIDSHRPFHLRNINSERVILLHDSDTFDTVNLPISFNLEDQWGNVLDSHSIDGESSDSDSASQSDSESDLSDYIDRDDVTRSANDSLSRAQIVSEDTATHDESNDFKHPIAAGSARADYVGDRNDKDQDISQGSSGNQPPRVNDAVEDYLDDIEKDDVAFDERGTDYQEDSDDDDVQIRRGTRKRHQNDLLEEEAARRKRHRARHRKRRQQKRTIEPDVEQEEKKRLQEYYSNANVATSSACISHGIAMLMRRGNQDSLWMAILGMTSQYMTSSIVEALYEDQSAFCREEVKLLQPNAAEDDGTSNVQNVGYVPSCTGAALQRIAQSVELRLDLLRHWSLFESLQNSSYTATRLATWRQTGKRRLLELLATLGIPLPDSKQQWCFMKHKSKIALEKHLRNAILRFDLGDRIQYDSFVRTLPGHRGDISAADFVHAVTALLEVDDSKWSLRPSSTGRLSAVDRFWRAYDALDTKRVNLLLDGLEMAMFVQRLTAEIGGDVIERKKFVPSGPFRYVFLRDEQHKEFLTQPILLRRLALFLNMALLRQGAKEKPFIILAPNVARDIWIAVAATTCTQRNDFGHRFRKAAERNGSTVTYSGFDSSVCEIKDGQEIEFVRFLHDVM